MYEFFLLNNILRTLLETIKLINEVRDFRSLPPQHVQCSLNIISKHVFISKHVLILNHKDNHIGSYSIAFNTLRFPSCSFHDLREHVSETHGLYRVEC